MPTPAIQTLRTDAQQVLNLDSISAVRSVVAATLANANAGTPLNPNLTTQQLWNEFYQIITQPKSDIESIIANQLMKFLYAPPAPGGVGANGQVIFNDGGVLAGDPQFLWNKTTNLLTVTGSATISGDLTVDTSTLKVDSANDKVGFGTTSPFTRADSLSSRNTALGSIAAFNTMPLSVTDDTAFATGVGGGLNFRAKLTSSTYSTYAGIWSYRESALNSDYAGSLIFGTSDNSNGYPIERFRISSSGVATWSVGGTTAMTLNSTGLGVGGSAITTNFEAIATSSGSIGGTATVSNIAASAAGNAASFNFRTNSNFRSSGYSSARIEAVTPAATNNTDLVFYNFKGVTISGDETMRITSDGNVGVGVTPSAWSANSKALQLGSIGTVENFNNADFNLGSNYYRTSGGTLAYSTTKFATAYSQSAANGTHAWLTAASGTAGNAASFTQAMTLDASGILMVGTTNSVIWNTTNTGCVVGGNAFQASRSDDVSLLLNRLGSNGKIALFARQGGEVGDISVTTTGTTFNSTSDYRLKEAVAPLSGGLARVNALKPSIYNWKSNGSTGEGFLAHELAEVVPAAVTGEKDAVNEDGSIKAQSIDMSRVVPILVAAIQELTAEVNALKKA